MREKEERMDGQLMEGVGWWEGKGVRRRFMGDGRGINGKGKRS